MLHRSFILYVCPYVRVPLTPYHRRPACPVVRPARPMQRCTLRLLALRPTVLRYRAQDQKFIDTSATPFEARGGGRRQVFVSGVRRSSELR